MSSIQIALAASLGLALATPVLADDAAPGGAATQAQEREQARARVRHQLVTQGGVSEGEANEVDAEVGAHAAHAGYGPAMQGAIQDALARGCTGQCLVDVVHGVNGAMDRGASPDAAARRASARADRASGTPSDPQARGDRHRRDLARRDASADRARDRAADRAVDRGMAGSHAMGGGRR